MKKLYLASILFLAIGFSNQLCAQDVVVGNTTLTQSDLVTGIQVPWEILWGPDGYIWVTERRGRVLRIEPESGNTETVLNIQSQVESGGEPGMLGMAMDPNFGDSPFVYIVYNYAVGGFNIRQRLVRFIWDGTNLIDEEILMDNLEGGGIHNGARLLVTTDNKLLFTRGDRGSSDDAQDMDELNGKLLRLNLDGSIPDDNPIPGSYIYSFGHRNAQGLCYGPNGLIYSSEHGQNQSDEFNLIMPDRNYGWPNVQGACNGGTEQAFCDANNVVEPLKEWTPCIAVNGIEYYNHPAIPEFENSVLMAVLGGLSGGHERISVLTMSEDGTEIVEELELFDNFGRLRDICVNPNTGAIYLATNGPNYPGSGPNRIVEYRNMDYTFVNVPSTLLENQYIKVFPNPMANKGQIEFSENFIGSTFEVISFNGQTVLSEKVNSNIVDLNLDKFAAGMYYVKATNETGMITRVFVVE